MNPWPWSVVNEYYLERRKKFSVLLYYLQSKDGKNFLCTDGSVQDRFIKLIVTRHGMVRPTYAP